MEDGNQPLVKSVRRNQAEGRAQCSVRSRGRAAERGPWAGRGAGGSPGLRPAFNADRVSQGTAEILQKKPHLRALSSAGKGWDERAGMKFNRGGKRGRVVGKRLGGVRRAPVPGPGHGAGGEGTAERGANVIPTGAREQGDRPRNECVCFQLSLLGRDQLAQGQGRG